MRQTDKEAFAAVDRIPLRRAWRFQRTGEHLIPRSEGGRVGDNIAAAWLYCNPLNPSLVRRQESQPPMKLTLLAV